MTTARRSLLKGVASMGALSLSSLSFAQTISPATTTPDRVFNPQPGKWRTFEVTTRVDILKTDGITRVWLPVPSINSDWQKSEN
ncbi:MAG: transglutaminase, partial [Betaproteobacteria bacterium]